MQITEAEKGHKNPTGYTKSYKIRHMILHVYMLVYSPSLLGDLNWVGGSFAWSHNLTAVYLFT